ncbi:hypothetical protein PUN28_018648 [Cardiocondyla obscurior]|uniref:HIT-type domain-containing protein n=1 Tax=Cardiocondyla obscurior TaxID=286306 RepID=A0AAW2EHJ6_9HYME
MNQSSRNCCVCERDNAAYKCPKCREFYCSVECCKAHKAQVCQPLEIREKSEERQQVNERRYEFPTEDTVPVKKLQQLRDNKALLKSLENSHLRSMMKEIMNSPNPTEAIALAMREPIFVEMADACLKVVEPLDDPGTS